MNTSLASSPLKTQLCVSVFRSFLVCFDGRHADGKPVDDFPSVASLMEPKQLS